MESKSARDFDSIFQAREKLLAPELLWLLSLKEEEFRANFPWQSRSPSEMARLDAERVRRRREHSG